MPDISAVIVNWNGGEALARCVASLVEQKGIDLEVVIIDNASSDQSARSAAQRYSSVHLIEAPRNLGFAGGANLGIRSSSARFVLLLNPDIEARPGAARSLLETLLAYRDAAAVAGKLLGANGQPQIGFNLRSFPTLRAMLFELLLVNRLFPRNPINIKYRMLDFDYRALQPVEQPAAACLLLRREALESVGLFDERFHPAWFEDVDLCLRLRRAGWRIYYNPEAEFEHAGGQSLERLAYRDFQLAYYRNMLRYFSKHHGAAPTLILRGALAAGMLLRLAALPLSAASERNRAAAYLAVLGAALFGRSRTWRAF